MTTDDKVNHVFQESKSFLDRVLAGYCLPEPYFTQRVKQSVETLMKCLKDPSMPLCELQVKTLFYGENFKGK